MSNHRRFLLHLLSFTVPGLLMMLYSCSKIVASSSRAETVFVAKPGYVCFIVRDDDGKGVGGNCVRETE